MTAEPRRSPPGTWPFPNGAADYTAPPDDVAIEDQRAIEAMQRGVEKRKASRVRDMKDDQA